MSVCAIKIAYVFSITYLLHINVGTKQVSVCIFTYFCFVHSTIFCFVAAAAAVTAVAVIVVAVVLVQILFRLLCRFDSILLYVRFIYTFSLSLNTHQNAVWVYLCVCVNCLVDVIRRSLTLNLLSHLNELMSTIQTCIHVYARVVVVYNNNNIFYFFSWSVVDTTVAFIHGRLYSSMCGRM